MIITVELVLHLAWMYFHPKSFGWFHLIFMNIAALFGIGSLVTQISKRGYISHDLSIIEMMVLFPIIIGVFLILYLLLTKLFIGMTKDKNQEASSST